MGRGRSQRQSARIFESDDDTISTNSSAESSEFSVSQEIDEDTGEAAELDSYLDALYEKRLSSREHGLNGLTRAFTRKVQLDFATSKGETLLHQCVSIIKRGSASEISLAAHVLGLLVLTVGESEIANMVFDESSPHLSRIAKQSSNATSRISALKSLAILTFVTGSDEETDSALNILWQVGSYNKAKYSDKDPGISEPTPEVRATALMSWSFLLTTVARDHVHFSHLEDAFPSFLHLLKMEDRSVRLAVGEGIIIFFERSGLSTSNFDYNGPFHLIGQERNTSTVDFAWRNTCEDVISQMKDLSIEAGGKGTSKKDLSSQRSLFCDILAYVEDGICPDILVKLSPSDALRISTWTNFAQVNMLKSFLGGGFQAHMLGNSFLHNVFDFKPKNAKKQVLSTKEKRMYLSPNSVVNKARTQELNKRRSNTQAGNYGHYSIHMSEE